MATPSMPAPLTGTNPARRRHRHLRLCVVLGSLLHHACLGQHLRILLDAVSSVEAPVSLARRGGIRRLQ